MSDINAGNNAQFEHKNKLTLIETGIYIGSKEETSNVNHLQAEKITHVLTVGEELNINLPSDFKHEKIDLADDVDKDISVHFGKAFSFIDLGCSGENKIMVHCGAGKSRSAALLIAYFMEKRKFNLQQAYNAIKTKRPTIDPNIGFWEQLAELEMKLFPDVESTLLQCIKPSQVRDDMAARKIPKERQQILQKILDHSKGEVPKVGTEGGRGKKETKEESRENGHHDVQSHSESSTTNNEVDDGGEGDDNLRQHDKNNDENSTTAPIDTPSFTPPLQHVEDEKQMVESQRPSSSSSSLPSRKLVVKDGKHETIPEEDENEGDDDTDEGTDKKDDEQDVNGEHNNDVSQEHPHSNFKFPQMEHSKQKGSVETSSMDDSHFPPSADTSVSSSLSHVSSSISKYNQQKEELLQLKLSHQTLEKQCQELRAQLAEKDFIIRQSQKKIDELHEEIKRVNQKEEGESDEPFLQTRQQLEKVIKDKEEKVLHFEKKEKDDETQKEHTKRVCDDLKRDIEVKRIEIENYKRILQQKDEQINQLKLQTDLSLQKKKRQENKNEAGVEGKENKQINEHDPNDDEQDREGNEDRDREGAIRQKDDEIDRLKAENAQLQFQYEKQVAIVLSLRQDLNQYTDASTRLDSTVRQLCSENEKLEQKNKALQHQLDQKLGTAHHNNGDAVLSSSIPITNFGPSLTNEQKEELKQMDEEQRNMVEKIYQNGLSVARITNDDDIQLLKFRIQELEKIVESKDLELAQLNNKALKSVNAEKNLIDSLLLSSSSSSVGEKHLSFDSESKQAVREDFDNYPRRRERFRKEGEEQEQGRIHSEDDYDNNGPITLEEANKRIKQLEAINRDLKREVRKKQGLHVIPYKRTGSHPRTKSTCNCVVFLRILFMIIIIGFAVMLGYQIFFPSSSFLSETFRSLFADSDSMY